MDNSYLRGPNMNSSVNKMPINSFFWGKKSFKICLKYSSINKELRTEETDFKKGTDGEKQIHSYLDSVLN